MDASKVIQRSNKQNKAQHLWFRMLADVLNEAGYEQKVVIGTIDVPWTEVIVKSIFKAIAKKQFDKEHTSDLTTKELTEVAETMTRALAMLGIKHVPFPSLEQIIAKQEERKKTNL